LQLSLLTGLNLLARKATCDNGNKPGALGFIAIREQFLPTISKSSAARFMDFAALCVAKFPTVGHFPPDHHSLAKGTLSPDQKQHVLDAASEAATGKSLSAFYAELRSCRPTKVKRRSRSKKAESNQQRVSKNRQSRFEIAIKAVSRVLENNDLARLSPGQRDLALALCKRWSEALLPANYPRSEINRSLPPALPNA
jgi:hypothetical protein